jgi:DNA-binding HxlR family transcriptional regulator
MLRQTGYGQFCPVAMAAEILGSRWTLPVLRELLCGSKRFNELRKGVPRMSPALLSQRLRELENAGIVQREQKPAGGFEYHLTEAGEDLRGVVESIGGWGQRWIDADISLRNLDASLLMWDMRRRIDPKPIPMQRAVIQFLYPEQTRTRQRWWLIIDNGTADLCSIDPGFDVDLYVSSDLRTMTQVWMGLTTVAAEERAGNLILTGDPVLKRTAQLWLGFSIFAPQEKNRGANIAMRGAQEKSLGAVS